MGWFMVSMLIKTEDFQFLKEYLRDEQDPDRTLFIASQELAIEELKGDIEKGNHACIATRAKAILDAVKEKLEAIQ